jgi:hypothetical protein
MKTKITGMFLIILSLFGIKASSQQLHIDSIPVTNATSCSACNGSAEAYLSGGVTPYTYQWSNGETTQTDINLCPGTYYLFATDSHGDSVGRSVTIGPASIVLATSSTNTGCIGNTGTASVSVSGGSTPYTYLWAPGGATTTSISTLSAGTYTISVTDANGCSRTSTATVSSATAIVFDSAQYITGATCSNNNGSAFVDPSGGTQPYTYLWSPNGATTATATGLSAGTYTVNVTDRNGCTGSTTLVVPSLGPVPTIATGNDSCNGYNDGFASVNSVSGGVSPYTYSWAPGGSTNNSISGLSAGYYVVTVTDKNGCTGTNSVYISQPQPLTFIVDTMPDSGSCTGSAIIIVSGGTYPYSFTWSVPVQSTFDTAGQQNVDSLCAGAYLVCITDVNGCSTCDSVHIRHATRVSGIANIKDNTGLIKIYPNPAASMLYIASNGIKPGSYTLYVYDMIGRQVVKLDDIIIGTGQTSQLDISELPTGKYMLRISSGDANKLAPFIVAH